MTRDELHEAARACIGDANALVRLHEGGWTDEQRGRVRDLRSRLRAISDATEPAHSLDDADLDGIRDDINQVMGR